MTADPRKLCIMKLTCIGDGYKYLLPLSEEFHSNYRLKAYIAHSPGQLTEVNQIPEAEIEACDLLIHHAPCWVNWGGKNNIYPDLIARFPAKTRRISVPLTTFAPLWPFHAHEPRNDDPDRPVDRHGAQPFFPYGDSVVQGMHKRGVPPEEIFKRYMAANISEYMDLDALVTHTRAQQEAREQVTDIKCLDFIFDNFRNRRVHTTVNHVSNATLIHMTDQILALLGYGPLDSYAHECLFELITPDMPIHPSLIRHFDLTWLTPYTRFRIDPQRNLTFEEYIWQYIDYVCAQQPAAEPLSPAA